MEENTTEQNQPEQQELNLDEVALLPVSQTPLTDMIKKEDLTPEEQMEFQIRIVKEKQFHLIKSLDATLTGLLNLLTSSGVTQIKRERIKKAIKVGILAGLDYGVDVAGIKMEQKGVFAKYEGFLGSTVARARENGMVIIAHNFKKEEDAKLNNPTGGTDEQNINQESGEINDQGTESQSVSEKVSNQDNQQT